MGAQFVFFQAICDLIFTCMLITKVLLDHFGHNQTDPTLPTDWTCTAIAFMDQVFSQGTITWNFMMSCAIIQTVYNAVHFRNTKIRIVVHHLYVWVSVIANAVALLLLDGYGPRKDGGCWIKPGWQSYFMAVPMSIYFLASIVSLAYVVINLKMFGKNLVRTRGDDEAGLISQISKYVTVFIVVWSLPFSTVIMGIFDIPCPGILFYSAYTCVTIQGFANSIVWMTSPPILKAFKEQFHHRIIYKVYSYRHFSMRDHAGKFSEQVKLIHEVEK